MQEGNWEAKIPGWRAGYTPKLKPKIHNVYIQCRGILESAKVTFDTHTEGDVKSVEMGEWAVIHSCIATQ